MLRALHSQTPGAAGSGHQPEAYPDAGMSGPALICRLSRGQRRIRHGDSPCHYLLEANMSAGVPGVNDASRTVAIDRPNLAMSGGRTGETEAHTRTIVDRARGVRLTEIFRRRSDAAIYWNEDRYGITTVAMRTTSLSEKQLFDIMVFRLAQYLQAGQLDPRLIFDRRLLHEPLSNVSSEDIHFLCGVSETGEILAYGTYRALPNNGFASRIRDLDRALFPVEEVFGQGLFNRLQDLPDLPVRQVREAGRLMKNHCTDVGQELTIRAPIELLLAAFRFASAAPQEFEACVGDVETGVAKKAMDFFQLPTILIGGTVPYCEEASFGLFNYQHRTRHPYAFRCSEISAQRLADVDAALSQPSQRGVEALIDLRDSAYAPRSSLEPAGGLPTLNTMDLALTGVPMSTRREMLKLGEWLRRTEPLRGLSVAEAAALGTLVHRTKFEAGDRLLRRRHAATGITFIEHGSALLSRAGRRCAEPDVLELAPFDYFGEASVLSGDMSTADVVAVTPGSALVLGRDVYSNALSVLPEVHAAFSRKMLERYTVDGRDDLAAEMHQ